MDAAARINASAVAAKTYDKRIMRRVHGYCIWMIAAATLSAGCAGRVSLFPNTDPALRKTPPQFAADAAMRHPFKADAPSGGEANGRAEVDYGLDVLEVVNLSDEDWDNVEIWLNRKYVVFVPKIEKGAPRTKVLNFQMIFDESGNSFPTNNISEENRIQKLEMLRGGKLYSLKLQLAD